MRMSYLAGMALGMLASVAVAAQVYKWVDDKGQVHYGDAPRGTKNRGVTQQNSDNISRDVEITTEDSKKMLESMQADRQQREQEKAQKQQLQARMQQRCNEARDTQRQYQSSGTLYRLDSKGTRVILNPDERKAAEEKNVQDIAKFCN